MSARHPSLVRLSQLGIAKARSRSAPPVTVRHLYPARGRFMNVDALVRSGLAVERGATSVPRVGGELPSLGAEYGLVRRSARCGCAGETEDVSKCGAGCGCGGSGEEDCGCKEEQGRDAPSSSGGAVVLRNAGTWMRARVYAAQSPAVARPRFGTLHAPPPREGSSAHKEAIPGEPFEIGESNCDLDPEYLRRLAYASASSYCLSQATTVPLCPSNWNWDDSICDWRYDCTECASDDVPGGGGPGGDDGGGDDDADLPECDWIFQQLGLCGFLIPFSTLSIWDRSVGEEEWDAENPSSPLGGNV
jgi:hypothetical protein